MGGSATERLLLRLRLENFLSKRLLYLSTQSGEDNNYPSVLLLGFSYYGETHVTHLSWVRLQNHGNVLGL